MEELIVSVIEGVTERLIGNDGKPYWRTPVTYITHTGREVASNLFTDRKKNMPIKIQQNRNAVSSGKMAYNPKTKMIVQLLG